MLFMLRIKIIGNKATGLVLRLAVILICLLFASCLTLEMQITASSSGQFELDLEYLLSPLYLQIYETELLQDYLFLPAKITELTARLTQAGGTLISVNSEDLNDGRKISCSISFPDAGSFADFMNSGAIRVQYDQAAGITQLLFETAGISTGRDWVTGDIRRYISSMFGTSLIKAQLLAPSSLSSAQLPIQNGNLAVYETTVAEYLFATSSEIIDLRW